MTKWLLVLFPMGTLAIASPESAARADTHCAALSDTFPHCGNGRAAFAPGSLPVYRMNNSAFQGELCMWGPHGRVCAHETACSSAEYAKGRCL